MVAITPHWCMVNTRDSQSYHQLICRHIDSNHRQSLICFYNLDNSGCFLPLHIIFDNIDNPGPQYKVCLKCQTVLKLLIKDGSKSYTYIFTLGYFSSKEKFSY